MLAEPENKSSALELIHGLFFLTFLVLAGWNCFLAWATYICGGDR